jgi:hypothetical protein
MNTFSCTLISLLLSYSYPCSPSLSVTISSTYHSVLNHYPSYISFSAPYHSSSRNLFPPIWKSQSLSLLLLSFFLSASLYLSPPLCLFLCFLFCTCALRLSSIAYFHVLLSQFTIILMSDSIWLRS